MTEPQVTVNPSDNVVETDRNENPSSRRLAAALRFLALTGASFDAEILASPNPDRLRVVYFWGQPCPNCAIATQQLSLIAEELKLLDADFYSVHAYENMELVTRFGLYGIPAFLFFKRGRMIGRITSFPQRDEFLNVIRRYV